MSIENFVLNTEPSREKVPTGKDFIGEVKGQSSSYEAAVKQFIAVAGPPSRVVNNCDIPLVERILEPLGLQLGGRQMLLPFAIPIYLATAFFGFRPKSVLGCRIDGCYEVSKKSETIASSQIPTTQN